MKNKFIIFLITFFLSINISAQETDYDYMKKHQKDVTYRIKTVKKNQKVTIFIDISFPKNYFSKKAQLVIQPTIKTNQREIKITDKINYKGENNKSSGKIVNFSNGLNDSYSFSKDLKQNEKILNVQLEFTLWSKGTGKKLYPLNLDKPEADTEIDINKATIEDINTLITKFNPEKDFDTLIALNERLGEKYLDKKEFEKASTSYLEAINFAEKNNKKFKAGKLYTNAGEISFKQDDNIQSIKYYTNALTNFKLENKTEYIIATNDNLATIFNSIAYYQDAIKSYEDAILYCQERDNIINFKNKIANVYIKMKNYIKAIEIYNEILVLVKNKEENENLVKILNNAAAAYTEINELQKAEQLIIRAIEINEKIGKNKYEAFLFNNYGNINLKNKKYELAVLNYEKALLSSKKNEKPHSQAINLHNLGKLYILQNNKNKAKEYFIESNKIANSPTDEDIISLNLNIIGELLLGETTCNTAFKDYKSYLLQTGTIIYYNDNPISNFFGEISKKITKQQLIAELTQKDVEYKKIVKLAENQKRLNKILELQKAQKEEKNKQQKKILTYLSIAFIIILLFAIITIRLYILKRRANTTLIEQNAQILMQNEEIKTQSDELLYKNQEILLIHEDLKEKNKIIEKKNRNITSSIDYAKNIQNAILPTANTINNLLNECFILYLPRDIVSGDFYWVAKTDNNETIIAAADCTGHGVPGAMMSMLGIAILNEIINDKKIFQPNIILNEMKNLLIKSLNQDKEIVNTRDSIEMALLKINNKTLKLEYAGAGNPLVIVRKNKIITYSADLMPVGFDIIKKEKLFTNNIIDLKKNDMLYIFSDGYRDQFGGAKNRKFYMKNLEKLFLNITKKPLDEQKQILEDKFYKWKGKQKQIDDVLVMGIKI